MKKLMTYEDVKGLNYNELAFLTGITPTAAKALIHEKLKLKKWTKSGKPSVPLTAKIAKEQIDIKVRSNDNRIDGADRIEYTVKMFNAGVDTGAIFRYAHNEGFIKHLKFTGLFDILNSILNREQYRKLQEIWLYKNCYGQKFFTLEAADFIQKNQDWAVKYLTGKGIAVAEKHLQHEKV